MNLRYEKVEGNRRTIERCREPDIGLDNARRAERSSRWDRLGETSARKAYSSEKTPNEETEGSSPTTSLEDVTVK